MKEAIGGVVINEVEAEPLSKYVIDFLTAQRKESPYLDFKYIINLDKNSNFPEIAKDIFAFANYGGGWIFIGWEEYPKSQYVPVGLPENYEADQAVIQEKFNSFCDNPITVDYMEFNKDFRSLFANLKESVKNKVNSISDRFAIMYIHPPYKIITPKKEGKYKKGNKEKIIFKEGDIFYRRGTQSIKPSEQELEIIKKRLEKENYRISVLSGEPDEIEETISGNLFEVTKLPEFVYLGNKKDYDDVSIKALLKQEGVFPEFYYKFKDWNKKIITFENLLETKNPYRKLVDTSTIVREPVNKWLEDVDKNRIIVELLNRELKHYAIGKGFFYFDKKNKLYYSTLTKERKEKWKSRYGVSTRTVAAKMYAEQLGGFIYWHAAFFPNFLQINDKFYLGILPTFIITENGKKPIFGFRIGTIITRLSYNKYNNSYLNTILFWIHQLGDGRDIQIKDYLTISAEPVKLQSSIGILHDVPSSEFRLDLMENEKETFREEYENEF